MVSVPDNAMQPADGGQLHEADVEIRIDRVGYTCGLRAGYEHNATLSREQHGRINLRDAPGVDADIACDGLSRGECPGLRHFQRPYTLSSEGI